MIDAHHHFWDPARADYPWMTGRLAALRRSFGPDDLRPLIAEAGVDHTIVVQARHAVDETEELLAVAHATDFVSGVVGWTDLTSTGVEEELQRLRSLEGGERLVGIRHQAHDEPDPGWLRRADVMRGIDEVGRTGLAYDLLIKPPQIPAALELASSLPDVRFVIDHLAKPPIASREVEPWREAMVPLAELPNVACKVSGMVTEAKWDRWRVEDLVPYVRVVWDLFGADRLMFGSDWPVCLLAGSYQNVFDAAAASLAQVCDLTDEVRAKLFGDNAIKHYRLA